MLSVIPRWPTSLQFELLIWDGKWNIKLRICLKYEALKAMSSLDYRDTGTSVLLFTDSCKIYEK